MNISSGSAFLPILGNRGRMLTPEERQRIEEEERKRIAEEQYRAEVRAKLQSALPAPARKPSRVPWILGVGGGAHHRHDCPDEQPEPVEDRAMTAAQ